MGCVNRQEVDPCHIGGGSRKVSADLRAQKAAGQNAVCTGDGNGLVPLQRRQLASLLTGDVDLLLALGDGCVLQLIQGEHIVTRGEIKSGDGLKARDDDINHNSFLLVICA